MADWHVDVVQLEGGRLAFVSYVVPTQEQQSSPQSFGLDEGLCGDDLQGLIAGNHPSGVKDWLGQVLKHSCKYSEGFFEKEELKCRFGGRVVFQTHVNYLDSATARDVLSKPVEFLHPGYNRVPVPDMERIRWLWDIFPLKYMVERWVVGDGTSEHPQLLCSNVHPGQAKVLLISSKGSSDSEEQKGCIETEFREAHQFFAEYFGESLAELSKDSITQDEWRAVTMLEYELAGARQSFRSKVGNANLISLPDASYDEVEAVFENLIGEFSLIVHYAGAVTEDGFNVEQSEVRKIDALDAGALVDLVSSRPVELLYVSCHQTDVPVCFVNFLRKIAHIGQNIHNVVSFRWSIPGYVALTVVNKVYSPSLREVAAETWKKLPSGVWRARRQLYELYCRETFRDKHSYCWAAPVLIRQASGQPLQEKGVELTGQERSRLVDEIKDERKLLNQEIERVFLRKTPIDLEDLSPQLAEDFFELQRRVGEYFDELETEAGSARFTSDRKRIMAKLGLRCSELYRDLDALEQREV